MTINKPTALYWHLWTDADGISRQAQCVMTNFDLQSITASADPQWLGKKTSGAMTVMVTVLPVGWVGAWHENPKPQWIVPLSGCWFVESMDGTCVQMKAGELAFGGDQNCREIEGKRGHKSGAVGEIPATLLLIQFDDATASPAPCEFR